MIAMTMVSLFGLIWGLLLTVIGVGIWAHIYMGVRDTKWTDTSLKEWVKEAPVMIFWLFIFIFFGTSALIYGPVIMWEILSGLWAQL